MIAKAAQYGGEIPRKAKCAAKRGDSRASG